MLEFTATDRHDSIIENHKVGATEGRMLLCLTGFSPEEVGLYGKVPAKVFAPRAAQAYAVILRLPIHGLPDLGTHAARLALLAEVAQSGYVRWHRP